MGRYSSHSACAFRKEFCNLHMPFRAFPAPMCPQTRGKLRFFALARGLLLYAHGELRRANLAQTKKTMTVRVRRERPDQRRHHRVTAPLFLRVGDDGPTVRATDWSLGGLRVDNYPHRPAGNRQRDRYRDDAALPGLRHLVHRQGQASSASPRISSSFAVEFTEIGERELELMHHFIEDLVRGAMSEVADSIQRIDVPITPVSTDPGSQVLGDRSSRKEASAAPDSLGWRLLDHRLPGVRLHGPGAVLEHLPHGGADRRGCRPDGRGPRPGRR